ncbi:MAG: transcriptional repressor [Deltaproteobacteria bacterium]|nr:transcriptional repressor [Deltaproteobacteria bacterium]
MKKLRNTEQRKIILEELKKVNTHPTADEVYEMVKKRLPRISIGTVYRNLELLSKCGLIQKLELGCSQMRFDWNTNNHYHIRCIRCGKVEDVPVETMSRFEKILEGKSDYEIIGHRLEFIGLCPKCKKELKDLKEEKQKEFRKEECSGLQEKINRRFR